MPLRSRRSYGISSAWLLPSLFLGFVAVAQAAPTRVGLLGVDGSAVEPGMGAILTDALRRNLPQLHGMRIEPRSQDLAEVKMVFGCGDERPECMTKVGRNLEVARLIYGSIRKQAGGYVVLIRQLNVADGTVEKTLSETVPKQILMEPSARLDEIIQGWLRQLLVEGLRGDLVVSSNPPGALVYVDGEPAGRTPHTAAGLDVGNHVLKIELTGYDPIVKTVQIRGNLSETVDTQLHAQTGAATAPSTTKPASRTNWTPLLRYTSYALYGLAGVTAIAALGTWGAKNKAEDQANAQIDRLIADLGPRAVDYASFFHSQASLSRCAGPDSLVGNAAYDAYADACRSGNRLAGAASGLWIAAGTFAVVGAATMLSTYFLKKDAEAATATADKPLNLRVAPSVVPSGAMVHVAFDF
jgi:hypothetical protein